MMERILDRNRSALAPLLVASLNPHGLAGKIRRMAPESKTADSSRAGRALSVQRVKAALASLFLR